MPNTITTEQAMQVLRQWVEAEFEEDAEDILERYDDDDIARLLAGKVVFISYTSITMQDNEIVCDFENAEEWVLGIGDGYGNLYEDDDDGDDE
jgi:hypothetical protein